MIGIIARHESMRQFRSAQYWLIAAAMAGIFGFLFLKQIEAFLSVQVQLSTLDHAVGLSGFMSVRYLEPLSLVFTLVSPLFAMRTFSDEYRQHTYALWQSSPVSTLALVLGKFMGVLQVLLPMVLLAVGMLLIMWFYTPIEPRLVLSASLGLTLCCAACSAVGVFFSSLTNQSLVAIFASIALLLLLWMLGSVNFSSLPLQSVNKLSIAVHLRGFFQGYIATQDIAYFLLMTCLFLGLTTIKLHSLRQTGH